MAHKAFLLGSISSAVSLYAWSAYVTHERKKIPPSTQFIVGSTDDILSERLKTGDLIMFRRNLLMMQPATALLTAATRKVFDTYYDHVGMIIKNRFGESLVLEVTQQGIRLRRFDERICWSKSDEIMALPLERAPTEEARVKAERYARSLTPERTTIWCNPRHSMTAELAGLAKFYWSRKNDSDKPDPTFMGAQVVSCRDAALVVATLEKMGLIGVEQWNKMIPPQLLTHQDLAEGRILLKNNRYCSENKLLIRYRDGSNQ